ncbi:hypothetical protein OH77DRAFT_1121322 [Trametes cingulata]|nr:hypothetical protein OH77DRAFT_1121322 [Trametes cingulata]
MRRRETDSEGSSLVHSSSLQAESASTTFPLQTIQTIPATSFIASPLPSSPISPVSPSPSPSPTSQSALPVATELDPPANHHVLLVALLSVAGALVLAALAVCAVVWYRRREARRVAPSTAWLRSVAVAAEGGEGHAGGLGRWGSASPGMGGAFGFAEMYGAGTLTIVTYTVQVLLDRFRAVICTETGVRLGGNGYGYASSCFTNLHDGMDVSALYDIRRTMVHLSTMTG